MKIAPPATTTPSPVVSNNKLQKAAAGFEAIFVRQMLAAARRGGAGDSVFGSEAQATFRQMLDDRFADIAAQKGVFGIGDMLKSQLSQEGK